MADSDRILRDANYRLSARRRTEGRSVWSADVGGDFDVVGLEIRYDVPHALVAAALNPEDGDVLARDRVYVVGGRPLCWARSYFDPALVGGTAIAQRDTGPGGVPARLVELGHEMVSFVEEVFFREPAEVTAEERDKLRIDEHTAVVRIMRTGFTADGRAVEVTDMRLVAKAYWFRWAWSNES